MNLEKNLYWFQRPLKFISNILEFLLSYHCYAEFRKIWPEKHGDQHCGRAWTSQLHHHVLRLHPSQLCFREIYCKLSFQCNFTQLITYICAFDYFQTNVLNRDFFNIDMIIKHWKRVLRCKLNNILQNNFTSR